MKTVAVIPAAGMGKRMGAGMNKQYLLLGGKPVVARTLSLFQDAEFIDEIYLVVPEAEIPFARSEVVEKFGLTKVTEIVPGGAERQNSVINGLRAIRNPAGDDIVVIHDGARPFVPPGAVRESVETARKLEGALVAVPAKDTVKIACDGMVTATPPRETVWLAQTPQTFRLGVILAAHEAAEREGFLGTDDASLVERAGGRIGIVPGDYRNIKMTTPEDMEIGEAFLRDARGEER